jgi:dihydrofolate reductase
MPCLSVIAAVASNRVIGRDNDLPWHLPEDLKHFRRLTMGHHIIMGRKTFESLGRLLPGRTTVVVSRQPGYRVDGAKVAGTLAEAVAACAGDDELFVIGGAELFREALQLADRLYLTEVHAEFAGDVFFPQYDAAAWHEAARERHVSADGLAYSFVTCQRGAAAQSCATQST